MYSAIIVEPRKHRALEYVLNNFLENLSNQWNIIIFHGNLNIDYINDIINNKLINYKNRISMINLNVDNLTIDQYNELFITNFDFYNKIPTETFLVFQTDTLINKKYKHFINQFLKYDYVGAPWKWAPFGVGNGGLSLRKKSKMLQIMKNDNNRYKNANNEFINEDVYFSMSKVVNLYKPSFQLAKKFSIEAIFSLMSFGCHKAYIHIDNNLLFKRYPDIKILRDLNS
jgi:hypothetical protein